MSSIHWAFWLCSLRSHIWLKIVLLPLHLVIGMSSCILPLLTGKNLFRWLEKLAMRGGSNHPDSNIIKIGKKYWEESLRPEETCSYSDSSKRPSANVGGETHKEYTTTITSNNNNNLSDDWISEKLTATKHRWLFVYAVLDYIYFELSIISHISRSTLTVCVSIFSGPIYGTNRSL